VLSVQKVCKIVCGDIIYVQSFDYLGIVCSVVTEPIVLECCLWERSRVGC